MPSVADDGIGASCVPMRLRRDGFSARCQHEPALPFTPDHGLIVASALTPRTAPVPAIDIMR